jgi:hypothetical protein
MPGEPKSTIKIDAKLQKYRPESSAGIIIRDDKIIIAGSTDHHITSDSVFGNFISGKTAIHANLGQIRVAGLWVLNPVLSSTIPSTMTTPNATLQLDIPLHNVDILADIVGMIKGFLV